MATFTPPTIEELQDQFPQYEIEGFIAQGGMGAVYLARQISLDRAVAIKILPQEFGEDADYRASFETEAKAMARLNHTNLVGIYDFGEINGMLFIVMEYIPGRTLFDTANGQQVDEKEAARLISDMSEGLAHAHEAGMLHRDIKPANVLIDDEAKPKIVDFGLARPMGEEETAGVVFGTPGYTAPEVLSNPYAVDHRSDIFSMGVMLYELLTGHLPGIPVVPVSRASDSDPRFDAIISKSIHPNPAMRYADADMLSKDLDALIEDFDSPGNTLGTSAGLATVARPIRGGALGVGSGHSMVSTVLPSAKKSNAGVVVVGLLVVVGIAIGLKVATSKNDGLSSEEVGRVTAAKQVEEQRKLELEAELRSYAAKQLEKKKTEDQARKREEERVAMLEESEERREAELARLEKAERLEAKALAKMERQRLAREKKLNREVGVSEFELEVFLKEKRGVMELKLGELSDEEGELLEPIYDKLERELKRLARGYAKGKKGQLAKEMVEKYIEGVRESREIVDFAGNVLFDVREEGGEILESYKEKSREAIEALDANKEALRLEYIDLLKNKQDELLKIQDEVGAATLSEPISSVKTVGDFMMLFEEEFDFSDEEIEKRKKEKAEAKKGR